MVDPCRKPSLTVFHTEQGPCPKHVLYRISFQKRDKLIQVSFSVDGTLEGWRYDVLRTCLTQAELTLSMALIVLTPVLLCCSSPGFCVVIPGLQWSEKMIRHCGSIA